MRSSRKSVWGGEGSRAGHGWGARDCSSRTALVSHPGIAARLQPRRRLGGCGQNPKRWLEIGLFFRASATAQVCVRCAAGAGCGAAVSGAEHAVGSQRRASSVSRSRVSAERRGRSRWHCEDNVDYHWRVPPGRLRARIGGKVSSHTVFQWRQPNDSLLLAPTLAAAAIGRKIGPSSCAGTFAHHFRCYFSLLPSPTAEAALRDRRSNKSLAVGEEELGPAAARGPAPPRPGRWEGRRGR